MLASAEIYAVRKYKLDRFADLGFNFDQSWLAVDSEIDWHEAEKLIRAGCPVDTAIRILYPL
jgi:hypothetical protein